MTAINLDMDELATDETQNEQGTRLDISGFIIYCNFQTWLDL